MKHPRTRHQWPPPDTVEPTCEICGDEVPRDTTRSMIADKPTLACAQCLSDLAEADATEISTPVRRF